jgi:hypothetical protein
MTEKDVPDIAVSGDDGQELVLVAKAHLILVDGIHLEWRTMHEDERRSCRRLAGISAMCAASS